METQDQLINKLDKVLTQAGYFHLEGNIYRHENGGNIDVAIIVHTDNL